MPTSALSVALQQLLADLRPDGDGRTDGELLARFVRSRDEDALAALVRRHASMVWGVCRRLLNHHDAEDAFQATFLVLVRKASGVPGQAVANWLYGVARQTAVRVRATAAKRGRRETQVVHRPEPTVPEVRDGDLQAVLDEELSRLPDHYRGVVVLCDLEGMTRKEAARQLGIPEGSVASRLARARAFLAKRLAQRGIVFSGSVAAVLSGSAWASAPPALVASTIKAASTLAAGKAAVAGVISVKVAALTDGVIKAMFLTKLKSAIAVVLILGLMATGATLLTYPAAAGQDGKHPASETPPTSVPKGVKENKEAFTAWGKADGGLQVGLGFRPGEQRTYYTGQSALLVLRVRNVGKGEASFNYSLEEFWENPPSVVDEKGRAVAIKGVASPKAVRTATLKAGEEIDLCQFDLVLQPPSERGKANSWTLYEVGKLQIQYKHVGLLPATKEKSDRELATGKLELVVKEPEVVKPILKAEEGDKPIPNENQNGTFDPADAGASLKWLKQRASAVQSAVDNGNELAAKVLTNRTKKEILEHKEVTWLVPVSRIGDDGLTLGGPRESDSEKRVEYSIRLTRRPAKDMQTASDDELRKLETLPTPTAEWVLGLKRGDRVRVKGKVTDAVVRYDQKFPVATIWISLDNIEITPVKLVGEGK